MSATLSMDFTRRPSVLAYMLRALRPSSGLRDGGRVPPIRAGWRGMRVDPRQLAEFLNLTGLPDDGQVPFLYPHVVGFPLQMAILTHAAFPLPIWGALQIRNRLLQHQPIPPAAAFELHTAVDAQRIVEKGVEVDLRSTLVMQGDRIWESVNTFYYRGRFGAAEAASPFAASPDAGDQVIAEWRTAADVGRRFGRLTGDYNGIHLWRWYARRFGFRRAFHHPQLVLGQCLARLPDAGTAFPRQLDTWLKGPVYYGSSVALRARLDSGSTSFALVSEGDTRPAVIGRITQAHTASQQNVTDWQRRDGA